MEPLLNKYRAETENLCLGIEGKFVKLMKKDPSSDKITKCTSEIETPPFITSYPVLTDEAIKIQSEQQFGEDRKIRLDLLTFISDGLVDDIDLYKQSCFNFIDTFQARYEQILRLMYEDGKKNPKSIFRIHVDKALDGAKTFKEDEWKKIEDEEIKKETMYVDAWPLFLKNANIPFINGVYTPKASEENPNPEPKEKLTLLSSAKGYEIVDIVKDERNSDNDEVIEVNIGPDMIKHRSFIAITYGETLYSTSAFYGVKAFLYKVKLIMSDEKVNEAFHKDVKREDIGRMTSWKMEKKHEREEEEEEEEDHGNKRAKVAEEE